MKISYRKKGTTLNYSLLLYYLITPQKCTNRVGIGYLFPNDIPCCLFHLSNLSLSILLKYFLFLSSLRRLEELQSQLSEEKEKAVHLNEQLQQEQSRREQELKETRDTHQSQISSLQDKIANLVSIVGHSQKKKLCFEN